MEVTEKPPKAENHAKSKRKELLVWLTLAFLLGCVVGARYLSHNGLGAFYLGTFLPPYTRNIGGNYWGHESPYRKLRKGMSKGEVVDLLAIQRADIVAGAALKQRARGIMHHGQLSDSDVAEIAEILLVPRRTEGITDYVCLAFDASQRLLRWGVGEFMLGYPTDPEAQFGAPAN